MQFRTLGPYTVSAIGLGAMPVSLNAAGSIPSHADAVSMVHAALEAGVTLIDTADIYAPDDQAMGHNERIVRDALASWGADTGTIVVATKGGITREANGSKGRNGSMEYLRSAVEASLRNLNVDVIDLYQYHRPDRWMVYGEVMQNLKTLKDEGKIRSIGISNASVEEIEIAEQVLGEGALVSVQNQFSPTYTGSYDELTFCGERGIAFLPWSPLGGTAGGARSVGERFPVFSEIAQQHGVSPQQVVLAWELSLGEHVIPIPGARRPASIADSAQAANLRLGADELERCQVAVGLA